MENKPNKIPKVKKHEAYTMFPKSKPWGYHPEAVEMRIKEYESALGRVNDQNQELIMQNNQLSSTIERLQQELKDLHFQLSSIELPETDELQESEILRSFKDFNSSNNGGQNEDPIHAGGNGGKLKFNKKGTTSLEANEIDIVTNESGNERYDSDESGDGNGFTIVT